MRTGQSTPLWWRASTGTDLRRRATSHRRTSSTEDRSLRPLNDRRLFPVPLNDADHLIRQRWNEVANARVNPPSVEPGLKVAGEHAVVVVDGDLHAAPNSSSCSR